MTWVKRGGAGTGMYGQDLPATDVSAEGHEPVVTPFRRGPGSGDGGHDFRNRANQELAPAYHVTRERPVRDNKILLDLLAHGVAT